MRLRVFDAVVHARTFAAAAQTLGLTPSAVSQHMARLEAEIDAVLFERTARGVDLTASGEVLHARTRRVLRELRSAEAELGHLRGLRTGRVALASFPSATQSLVAAALSEFHRRYPGTAVTLVEHAPERNLMELSAGSVELALVFEWIGEDARTDRRQFVVTPLLREPCDLVVPSGHRLARRGTQPTLSDLRDEHLVGTGREPAWQWLVRLAAEEGFDPLFTGHVTTSYQTVRALVAAGDGVALIPCTALTRPFDGTERVHLTGTVPEREVLVARARTRVESAPARALRAIREDTAAPV